MNVARRIANPPAKPLMLFDGDCRFCRLWIARWKQSTGDVVEYKELQAANFAELSRAELEEAVHFISADGAVYRGAEAVFRSLAVNPGGQWPLRIYQGSPRLAAIIEAVYAFIATRRQLFSLVTRGLWGKHVERSPDVLTRWLFLRGLGVIYLIAFVSLWVQMAGLIGQRGILPAGDFMSEVKQAFAGHEVGVDRFRQLPTLCWISASDTSLNVQCALGAALALGLIVGVAPWICLIGLWVLYLSLSSVGQEFLGFQWDALLLEVGLLAVFFAPWQLLPNRRREKPPSRAVHWLLRLLLFKLMFLSGVVKIASGDPLWRNLTALARHYETQPLPNVLAWYFHQLPLWFHKGSCALMFATELGAPFLLFLPRRPRMIGGIALAALQIFILLTGNFTFFNWLTLVLCILAFDDFTWAAILPGRVSTMYEGATESLRESRLMHWRNVPMAAMALVFGGISLVQVLGVSGWRPFWSAPFARAERWLAPLRSVSTYGLFAVMTPERPEIIVEGSNDGREWKEYTFRHKPGAANRRPTFAAPHQPRLDWQMWFAALGDVRQNPWFVNFCLRLLQGSPEVVGLLESDPFPNAPPKYVRARLYDYKFTTREERGRTGNWWKRELKGEYLPAISLEMLQR